MGFEGAPPLQTSLNKRPLFGDVASLKTYLLLRGRNTNSGGKILKESLREAKPLLHNQFPLPLIKGKGIKGIGL